MLFSFALMTAKQELQERHNAIYKKIQESSSTKGSIMYLCEAVAKKLGFTKQTVYNYINGRINDGYLADAIYKEIKKYKRPK